MNPSDRFSSLRAWSARALTTFLLTGVLAAQETLWTPEDAAVLTDAQRALEAGRAREALGTLDGLRKTYPGSMDVQRLRGHALAALGRASEARAAFADALARGALSADVLSGLLALDYERERVPAVLAESQLLLLLQPDNAEWALVHADLLLQYGRPEAAGLIYRSLLDGGGATPDLCERIARAAWEAGRSKEAASFFETAYYLGSANPELAGMLVTVWTQLGDAERSQTWRERMDGTQRASEPPLRAAMRFLAIGDRERARAEAETVLVTGDATLVAEASVLLGRIARSEGNDGEALDWFRRAVDAGSGEPDVLVALGGDAFNRKDMGTAAGLLARAWDAGRRDASILPYLVQSAMAAGRLADADRFLVEYLERNGMDATARGMIAQRAKRKG